MTVLAAIFVFFIIVVVHELGHFTVAKVVGVKVHEFAIGMGPRIFKVKKGETEYSLRILPIGGYVKMEGEDEDSHDQGSINTKPPLSRIAVFAAGSIMNLILAVVIFSIIAFNTGAITTTIENLDKSLPAYDEGIRPGDTIVKINDKSTGTWDSIVNEINISQGKELKITVRRNDDIKDFYIKPVLRELEDGTKSYLIGITPKVSTDLKSVIKSGLEKTIFFLSYMLDFIKQAIRGNVSSGDVAGPVGVISLVGEAAKYGFLNLLYIAGFLSINLGFINLLPIPALDGSRIMFGLIELVRGKPINPEKEGFIHFIGFVLLISLMIFITFKDVVRLDIF